MIELHISAETCKNVGDLKRIIAALPDDTLVGHWVAEGHDGYYPGLPLKWTLVARHDDNFSKHLVENPNYYKIPAENQIQALLFGLS